MTRQKEMKPEMIDEEKAQAFANEVALQHAFRFISVKSKLAFRDFRRRFRAEPARQLLDDKTNIIYLLPENYDAKVHGPLTELPSYPTKYRFDGAN